MEVETPAHAAVQPEDPAEVATESPAPTTVQPDASAVSMEVESTAPAAVQPVAPAVAAETETLAPAAEQSDLGLAYYSGNSFGYPILRFFSPHILARFWASKKRLASFAIF
eukprot:1061882-Pleurochrysis_carterae.AAC.2